MVPHTAKWPSAVLPAQALLVPQLLVVVLAAADAGFRRLPRRHTHIAMHCFLEHIQSLLFAGCSTPYEHQATLFRWQRWSFRSWATYMRQGTRQIWPWSGWLVIVARSGHPNQNSLTAFPVPTRPHPQCGMPARRTMSVTSCR